MQFEDELASVQAKVEYLNAVIQRLESIIDDLEFQGGKGAAGTSEEDEIPSAFGWIKSSGSTATIDGGPILTANGVVWVDENDVSCGGSSDNPHIIFVEGSPDGTGSKINGTSVAKNAFIGHTEGKFRRPIWEVYITSDGNVARKRWLVTAVDLRSWYSAE